MSVVIAPISSDVARDGDRAELVETAEVDEHVRGRRPLLHHVQERLAPGEGTGSVVLGEQRDRLLDSARPRVGNLSQQHEADSVTHVPLTCQGTAPW